MAENGKISANWRIERGPLRRAKIAGFDLAVTNRRTNGGWGPIRWSIWKDGAMVAEGQVFQGGRYQSLVEQAMFVAEIEAQNRASGAVR